MNKKGRVVLMYGDSLKVADTSRVASERGVSITGLPQRGSLDVLQTEKGP